jgi:hypothetical protein
MLPVLSSLSLNQAAKAELQWRPAFTRRPDVPARRCPLGGIQQGAVIDGRSPSEDS